MGYTSGTRALTAAAILGILAMYWLTKHPTREGLDTQKHPCCATGSVLYGQGEYGALPNQKGTWSKAAPCCTDTECSAPVPCPLPKGCVLPPSLGPHIEGGDSAPCAAGRPIENGKTCSVKCAQGFRAASGSTTYSCDGEGSLQAATLNCVPNTCVLPSSLGEGVGGSGSEPCRAGEKLEAGKSCEIQCESGFEEDGEGEKGDSAKKFQCSVSGDLTDPGLVCNKVKVRPYNSIWAIDI